MFWSVTDEQLLFYGVVEVTALLEGSDIHFEECSQPAWLKNPVSSTMTVMRDVNALLPFCRKAGSAH